MNERTVILAVEDALSEAVSLRILMSLGITVGQRLGLRGKGYLQNKAQSLNRTARGLAVFMLADQDSRSQCPPQLIASWIKGPRHPHFLLRVAVMEIESWVMADRRGIARFLAIPSNKIPNDTDALPRPKEFLVGLARSSRKTRLRADMVPEPGAASSVGPGYNSRLAEFVRKDWNIKGASAVSQSLNRTLARLRNFRESFTVTGICQ